MSADGEGPARSPQPGLAELQTLAEQLHQSGLEIELDVSIESNGLPPGLDLAAYRIVQEALTNALKHGGPGRARVFVHRERDALAVEVLNEGRVSATNESGGFGLLGMAERIGLYGGELEHGRGENGWYRVRARLPLDGGEQ
jgi:signal transduction histidine kinase